jgi:hypothetical protein
MEILVIRDNGIKTGQQAILVETFTKVLTEDMLRDIYRKYVYKKHARDLVACYNIYVVIFFTKPQLIQPLSGHVRA